MSERTVNKVEPKNIKGDDLMAFVIYGKVKAVDADGLRLIVTDIFGKEISIKGKDLIENSLSADQYQEEQKIGKTKAEEIFTSSANKPLTVAFEKADGTVRTLRGRYIGPGPLGRSMVEDLDIDDPKDRIRQVDNRTISLLIVDGVKYVVK
jgi:hypothetical protein